jgi:hypothetical protein
MCDHCTEVFFLALEARKIVEGTLRYLYCLEEKKARKGEYDE